MIRVGIIGATGYTGIELLRLLCARDDVKIVVVTSRDQQGVALADYFPSLRGHTQLSFADPATADFSHCDVVFFATPHGVAMHSAAEILAAGPKIIDLSADFRIKDIALWQQWYGVEHASADLVERAVYGLPEVNREAIASADLVAVPGCYPTAIQLGFLPLLELGLVNSKQLIADAKSGVSGAGRKAAQDYLLCETTESIKAYGVSGHRHHPEIIQGLQRAAEQSSNTSDTVGLTFVPHLVPMVRGILATLYAPLKSDSKITLDQLQSIFEDRYATEPFVDVLPQGVLPATRDVRGSNRCALSVNYNASTETVIVIAAEDNLVKGAAGQAIQNMNIMFGLDETKGLNSIAINP